MSDADRLGYEERLAKDGPESPAGKDMPLAWFPVRGQDHKAVSGLITGERDGRLWVLLSTRPGDVMLPGKGWTVASAYRNNDSMGRPAIAFKLDEAGGKLFLALTSSHVHQAMAILVGGEVASAPTVQSAISDRGQITGAFTAREVEEYVGMLGAGQLPAQVTAHTLTIGHVADATPDNAFARLALLFALGVVAVGSFFRGFRAMARSRVVPFGLWAIVAAASASGWWYAAEWNGFLVGLMPLLSMIILAVPLVPLLIVWVIALALAARQPKAEP